MLDFDNEGQSVELTRNLTFTSLTPYAVNLVPAVTTGLGARLGSAALAQVAFFV
jgi:hypothetical protein